MTKKRSSAKPRNTSSDPVVLDIESYYDKEYSLRKLSNLEYIRDARFKVHVLGVLKGGNKTFVKGPDVPAFLKKFSQEQTVICHNCFFDAAILAWKYNWRAKRYVDTLALANAVVGPARDGGGGKNDLDTLAGKLDLGEGKLELAWSKGVIDLTPAQYETMVTYLGRDLELTREVYDKLWPQLTNQEEEGWLIDHTLRIFLDRHLDIDPVKIKKARSVAQKRLKELVAASGSTPQVLASNVQFANELRERMKQAGIQMPMKRGKKGMIPALAKTDPAFLRLAESTVTPIAALIRARLVVRSTANIIARLQTLEANVKDGLPVSLVYHGAHTGRWSAGGGFNFLNLTSPDRQTDPIDREIAGLIREAVIAGKGQVFVESDAANIEARVLAWIADEQKLLADFAKSVDVYSKFISGVLHEDIHKPKDTDPAERVPRLKTMRNVGKIAILGLGYNMGVLKHAGQLSAAADVAKALNINRGLPLERQPELLKFAGNNVKHYRDEYPKIVAFWTAIEEMFQASFAGRVGAVRTMGHLSFKRLADAEVGIILPSGRMIRYGHLRYEKRVGTMSYVDFTGKSISREAKGLELRYGNGQKVYGGLLTENVVQAISRDILIQAIFALEEAGYPVVLHVYDSVVARVPKAQGEAALKLLNASLSNVPKWGKGMVLGAEGHIANDLGK